MSNGFIFDDVNLQAILESINKRIGDYEAKVTEITNLVKEIRDSSLWKDEILKTSFVNTCNTYLDAYKINIKVLKTYYGYALRKCKAFADLESAYSR